jgi:hypothetical protein
VYLIGERVKPSVFGLDALASFRISDGVPRHSAFYAISQKPKNVKVSGVMKPKNSSLILFSVYVPNASEPMSYESEGSHQ